MKICFQMYRDGNFFIPTDEVEWDIAFSQIVLHILVQIFMLIKHVQDMIRARWVCWHNNSIVILFFHKLSNTYNIEHYLRWSIFLRILMLIKDEISERWAS